MIDVIMGLQWGSEAKGVAATELAQRFKYDVAATTNSCQSGHTSYIKKELCPKYGGEDKYVKVVNRQLPSSFPYVEKIVIGAGAMIKMEVLIEEIKYIEKLGLEVRSKLIIDPHAGIIADDAGEKESEIVDRIASTGEGVGFAWTERIMRKAPLAKDIEELKSYATIEEVAPIINNPNYKVLLEGSQGFGLSLFYGSYPHVTSRDTGVLTLLAGIGANPKRIGKCYGVARTFPIRVGSTKNTSGHMKGELAWEEIEQISGYEKLGEVTTVTGRLRRIAQWDSELVKKACEMNGIDEVILTFVNYINCNDENVQSYKDLSDESTYFIDLIKDEGIPIKYASTNKYHMFEV